MDRGLLAFKSTAGTNSSKSSSILSSPSMSIQHQLQHYQPQISPRLSIQQSNSSNSSQPKSTLAAAGAGTPIPGGALSNTTSIHANKPPPATISSRNANSLNKQTQLQLQQQQSLLQPQSSTSSSSSTTTATTSTRSTYNQNNLNNSAPKSSFQLHDKQPLSVVSPSRLQSKPTLNPSVSSNFSRSHANASAIGQLSTNAALARQQYDLNTCGFIRPKTQSPIASKQQIQQQSQIISSTSHSLPQHANHMKISQSPSPNSSTSLTHTIPGAASTGSSSQKKPSMIPNSYLTPQQYGTTPTPNNKQQLTFLNLNSTTTLPQTQQSPAASPHQASTTISISPIGVVGVGATTDPVSQLNNTHLITENSSDISSVIPMMNNYANQNNNNNPPPSPIYTINLFDDISSSSKSGSQKTIVPAYFPLFSQPSSSPSSCKNSNKTLNSQQENLSLSTTPNQLYFQKENINQTSTPLSNLRSRQNWQLQSAAADIPKEHLCESSSQSVTNQNQSNQNMCSTCSEGNNSAVRSTQKELNSTPTTKFDCQKCSSTRFGENKLTTDTNQIHNNKLNTAIPTIQLQTPQNQHQHHIKEQSFGHSHAHIGSEGTITTTPSSQTLLPPYAGVDNEIQKSQINQLTNLQHPSQTLTPSSSNASARFPLELSIHSPSPKPPIVSTPPISPIPNLTGLTPSTSTQINPAIEQFPFSTFNKQNAYNTTQLIALDNRLLNQKQSTLPLNDSISQKISPKNPVGSEEYSQNGQSPPLQSALTSLDPLPSQQYLLNLSMPPSHTLGITPNNISAIQEQQYLPSSPQQIKQIKLQRFSEHLTSSKSAFSHTLKQFNERSEQSIASYHSNLKFLDSVQQQIHETVDALVAESKAQLIASFNSALANSKTKLFQIQQILNYLQSTEKDLLSNIDCIIADMDIASLDDIIAEYTTMIDAYESTRQTSLLLPTTFSQLDMTHKSNSTLLNSIHQQIQAELTKIFHMQETILPIDQAFLPTANFIPTVSTTAPSQTPAISSQHTLSNNDTAQLQQQSNSLEIQNQSKQFEIPSQLHQKSQQFSFQNKDQFSAEKQQINSISKLPTITTPPTTTVKPKILSFSLNPSQQHLILESEQPEKAISSYEFTSPSSTDAKGLADSSKIGQQQQQQQLLLPASPSFLNPSKLSNTTTISEQPTTTTQEENIQCYPIDFSGKSPAALLMHSGPPFPIQIPQQSFAELIVTNSSSLSVTTTVLPQVSSNTKQQLLQPEQQQQQQQQQAEQQKQQLKQQQIHQNQQQNGNIPPSGTSQLIKLKFLNQLEAHLNTDTSTNDKSLQQDHGITKKKNFCKLISEEESDKLKQQQKQQQHQLQSSVPGKITSNSKIASVSSNLERSGGIGSVGTILQQLPQKQIQQSSSHGINSSNMNNANSKQKYNELIDRIQMSQSNTEKLCSDLLINNSVSATINSNPSIKSPSIKL